MNLSQALEIFFVLGFLSVGVILFYLRRQKVGFWFFVALLLRCSTAVFLEFAGKYYLVVDNMKYESDAWNIAQSWLSPDVFRFDMPEVGNLYAYVVAVFYYLFGPNSLMSVFFNGVCSIGAMFLIYDITRRMCDLSEKRESERKVPLYGVILLAFYPSFVVWSAANIRDPLYLLLATTFVWIVLCFSRFSGISKLAALLGAALVLFILSWIRDYAVYLLLCGLGAGVVFQWLGRNVSFSGWLRRCLFLGGASILLAGLFAPGWSAQVLQFFQEKRISLAELNTDHAARSSFLLHYELSSIPRLLAYLPMGLSYYFFAPFPWEVRSFSQALALPEVFFVWFLALPTYRGMRELFRRNPTQTCLLMGMIVSLTLSQTLAESNMGTLFRHRTLTFLLLTPFTAMGVAIWRSSLRRVPLKNLSSPSESPS